MAAYAWIDGAFVEETAGSVSVGDMGLLHAAGVFTTMRSYGGRVFRLQQHLARIRASCEALFIPLQYKDEALMSAVDELLRRNDLAEARLRLTVTRGTAGRDPLHGLRLTPTVFLTATKLEPYPAEYYQRGLTVMLLDEQKLNPYDIQAGHKTLNYFSRLAALSAALQRGAGEALWFNVHNYLQSGSISNVFMVKNGELLTPPTSAEMRSADLTDPVPYVKSNVLPGITRETVIELARSAEIPVWFASINVNELLAAEEVFLTNCIMEVMPVCRLEGVSLGNERPGPVTLRLAELYQLATQAT